MTALSVRKALEKAYKAGEVWHDAPPTALKISYIGRLEELFQHRSPAPHRSRQHVKALAKVPGQMGRDLSPIRIWWGGHKWGWLCIDGHHRLDAYQLAGRTEPVPVEVFGGTLDEALLEALRGNTRNQLPMEEREKLNAAWRTVVAVGGAQSKRAIAEAAGVSERTIANMRSAAKLFQEQRPHHDPTSFTWRQAQELVQGIEAPKGNAGEAREKRLQKLTDALISKFGPTLSRDPELFAEALRRCDPALPSALREAFEQMEQEAEQETLSDQEWNAKAGSLPFTAQRPEEEPI